MECVIPVRQKRVCPRAVREEGGNERSLAAAMAVCRTSSGMKHPRSRNKVTSLSLRTVTARTRGRIGADEAGRRLGEPDSSAIHTPCVSTFKPESKSISAHR